MFKHLTVILAFLMTLSSPVSALDMEKGLAAYQAGAYATAIQVSTRLAAAGNANAQTSSWIMYENGLGVPQDYEESVVVPISC